MTPDPDIIPYLERAKPLFDVPLDLLHVERFGLAPFFEDGKPVLAMRLYFHEAFDPTKVHELTLIMDPDGAVEYDIATPEQVDILFAHFSPDAPAEQPTEESDQ